VNELPKEAQAILTRIKRTAKSKTNSVNTFKIIDEAVIEAFYYGYETASQELEKAHRKEIRHLEMELRRSNQTRA
jgi:radical SAM superfamily enzyme YgiQ (UPF0313 family)